MRARHLIYIFLGTRSQSRRWLYILAALLPVWLSVEFIMSIYRVFYWSYALIVFICLWQVFRPTVAGWAAIIVFYGYALVEVLADLATQFMDYGSEDHSAWEGWFTASSCVGLAIFMAVILVAIARQFPRGSGAAT